ncbi:MAG TPA: response regulator transcription factor [Actinomycetota bacterium]|nr:response regulator transcription factor [Actinomycetota bacterium]
MERPTIRLLLVDDHEVVLRGLRDFFTAEPDTEVIASASSAEEALEILAREVPDVAVLDLRLPAMNGVSLCGAIKGRYPQVQCLMLSSFANENHVFDAMQGGASGFVLKDSPLEDVARAVRTIARGESVVDPSLTAKLWGRFRADTREQKLTLLTRQERKVLDLVATGASNHQIAEHLCLAEQTVKNYVSSILSKLGVEGRTQAALFAVQAVEFDHEQRA